MQTPFSSVSQGFHFPNRFEIKLPVKFQLPLAGTIDLNDVVFGLCGGMCFAALDYFHTHHTLPQATSPKEIDASLLVYLCERQVESLQIPVLVKILDWALSSDDDLAARMIKTEIPKLRKLLDAGEPAVLCLIRTKGFDNPTENHQVVATGYEIDDSAGKINFTLYDPNYPGQAPTLSVSLKRKGFSISESTGDALRGFFLMPYKPQTAVPLPSPAAAPGPAASAPAPAPFGEPAFGVPAAPGAFEELGLAPEAAPESARELDFAAAPETGLPFRLKWPVDSQRINQCFGENPAMYRPFRLAGHEGVDFFALSGANVYACFDGTVFEAKYRGAYGNQVRIQHESNGTKFKTVYAHLEKMLVHAGQQVRAGDLIGKADNTGNSHGAHLHLTLFIDGAKTPGYYDGIVDPWPYMEGNEPPRPSTLSGVTVFTSGEINLRSQASAQNSEVLASIPAGERLQVFGDAAAARDRIGKQDQWLQVQASSGLVGFVAAWLVADAAQQVFPPADLVVFAFDTIPIRSGPDAALSQVGTAAATTPLVVLGTTDTARAKIGQPGQWLQVQPPDGAQGFIPAWLVRLTGQVPPSTDLLVCAGGNVNLRAQPNTNPETDILAVVTPHDDLTVLGDKDLARAKIGRQDSWINVRGPDGMVGWIAAWLVSPKTGGPQPAAAAQPAQPNGLTVFPTPDIGVNLRATADAASMRVSGAICGEPLAVLDADLVAARNKVGVQDQWLYVQKSNGERGWVAAWFVNLSA